MGDEVGINVGATVGKADGAAVVDKVVGLADGAAVGRADGVGIV